jgi:hypothetical protein
MTTFGCRLLLGWPKPPQYRNTGRRMRAMALRQLRTDNGVDEASFRIDLNIPSAHQLNFKPCRRGRACADVRHPCHCKSNGYAMTHCGLSAACMPRAHNSPGRGFLQSAADEQRNGAANYFETLQSLSAPLETIAPYRAQRAPASTAVNSRSVLCAASSMVMRT